MITQLPTGNLLAQRGNQTIEFVLCPRKGKWVHPVRKPWGRVKRTRLVATVEQWAKEIFDCKAFEWSIGNERPDY